MPELPEVETVKLGLAKLLPGLVIAHVKSDWPKSFPNSASDVGSFLVGASVVGVRRRAKVLLIDLSGLHTLVVHLKMTGQLVFVAEAQKSTEYPVQSTEGSDKPLDSKIQDPRSKISQLRFGAGHPTSSLVGMLPDKSTRVTLDFKDGSKLFFNDQRKFGWMKLIPTSEVPNIDFMKKVGPEPLSDEFTAKVFIARIRRRANTTIKAALLDQTVLAGIGNIYADETLWGAKIHPATRVCDVSDSKLKKLHKEIRLVLNLAIKKGGSTNKNYVNAEGKKGSYMSFARVFRRENLPCPHCGTTIIKSRVAGRGTHTCPKCQELAE